MQHKHTDFLFLATAHPPTSLGRIFRLNHGCAPFLSRCAGTLSGLVHESDCDTPPAPFPNPCTRLSYPIPTPPPCNGLRFPQYHVRVPDCSTSKSLQQMVSPLISLHQTAHTHPIPVSDTSSNFPPPCIGLSTTKCLYLMAHTHRIPGSELLLSLPPL